MSSLKYVMVDGRLKTCPGRHTTTVDAGGGLGVKGVCQPRTPSVVAVKSFCMEEQPYPREWESSRILKNFSGWFKGHRGRFGPRFLKTGKNYYMQREYLFRGKSVMTGDWVYGSLIINGEYSYAIYDCNKHTDYNGEEVDEETIGQYSGLNDKNRERIFEGDVIELINADGIKIKAVCEYGIARREVLINPVRAIEVDISCFYFKLPNGKKSFPIVNNYAGKHDLELFEVIGSIHENDAPAIEGTTHMLQDPGTKQSEAEGAAAETQATEANETQEGAEVKDVEGLD